MLIRITPYVIPASRLGRRIASIFLQLKEFNVSHSDTSASNDDQESEEGAASRVNLLPRPPEYLDFASEVPIHTVRPLVHSSLRQFLTKAPPRALEWLLNSLTLVALVLTVAVLANRYVFSSSERKPRPLTPIEGATINLPGLDWTNKSPALIFALSTDCKYCTESSAFYQELLRTIPPESVRPIALFPQPMEKARAYLDSLQLPLTDVRQADFKSLGIGGTPTLILVDRLGRVHSSWVGRLSPQHEAEVFRALETASPNQHPPQSQDAAPKGPAEPNLLTAAQFRDLLRKEAVAPVIDIRPRDEYRIGHIADSLNIPIDELQFRMPHEVPKWPTVVIYCNSCNSCEAGTKVQAGATRCSVAARMLNLMGYSKYRMISEDLATLQRAGIKISGSLKPPTKRPSPPS